MQRSSFTGAAQYSSPNEKFKFYIFDSPRFNLNTPKSPYASMTLEYVFLIVSFSAEAVERKRKICWCKSPDTMAPRTSHFKPKTRGITKAAFMWRFWKEIKMYEHMALYNGKRGIDSVTKYGHATFLSNKKKDLQKLQALLKKYTGIFNNNISYKKHLEHRQIRCLRTLSCN